MNISSLQPLMPPLGLSTAFFQSPVAKTNDLPDDTFGVSSMDPGPSSLRNRAQTMQSSTNGTMDNRQRSSSRMSLDGQGSESKPFTSALVLDGVNGKGKSKSLAVAKRKREFDSATAMSFAADNASDSPKKKKANRACYSCQKAHLTCDDTRPCQRCVRKGTADQCIEGQRKKAKYLLEDDELEAMKKPGPEDTVQSGDNTSNGGLAMPDYLSSDALFNVPFDSTYEFASDAANLEYNILSAILGNQPLPAPQPNMRSQAQQSPTGLPPEQAYDMMWQPQNQQPSQDVNQMQNGNNNSIFPQTYSGSGSSSVTNIYPTPQTLNSQSNSFSPQSISPVQNVSDPRISPSTSTSYLRTAMPPAPDQGVLSQALAPPSPPASTDDSPGSQTLQPGTSMPPSSTQGFDGMQMVQSVDPSTEVYRSITRGYDYTEGYHFLMKFLPERFEKNDILRVVRALAIFRPSLIALQMPLSEEDEVFVEKSFQRTLIELDKLISFSGTPTVVWRRTGEICLVGLEFSMLTNWSKDELLTGRKYIYELFENQSVVEYWEKFASHAFENSSQSVYTHCVLLKPDGSPVPCAFCFSIRRDIFDLPSVVIGQWLPLL